MRPRKRSQAAGILSDLRFIDSAVDQYAFETGKQSGDPGGAGRLEQLPEAQHESLSHRSGYFWKRLRAADCRQFAISSRDRSNCALRRGRHGLLVAVSIASGKLER